MATFFELLANKIPVADTTQYPSFDGKSNSDNCLVKSPIYQSSHFLDAIISFLIAIPIFDFSKTKMTIRNIIDKIFQRTFHLISNLN